MAVAYTSYYWWDDHEGMNGMKLTFCKNDDWQIQHDHVIDEDDLLSTAEQMMCDENQYVYKAQI